MYLLIRIGGSAASACKVILSSYLPSIHKDQAVGWEIWAAAVKVNAMCIRRGLAGIATGIGKSPWDVKKPASIDHSVGTRRGLRIAITKQGFMDINSTRSYLERFMPDEISGS